VFRLKEDANQKAKLSLVSFKNQRLV